MTVAVLFALPVEFRAWRRDHPFHRIQHSGRTYYETNIGATPVRVAITGIGAPRLVLPDTDLIVVAGLAGGLKPHYRSGEVVVARRVGSGAGDPTVDIDGRLVRLAERSGATVVDALLSCDRIVAEAAAKSRLGDRADAVDMESFAVIREAASRGIPGIAVRVIGDAVGEDIPIDIEDALTPAGGLSAVRLASAIARRPDRWMALWRFAGAQRVALTNLARFLDRFVGAVEDDRASAAARDRETPARAAE